jgi:hypothetical protein
MFSNHNHSIRRSLLTLALGVALTAGATVASAKESRHRESLTNSSELRDDRRDARDDRGDEKQLERAVEQWRQAYRHSDEAKMQAADRVINAWVAQELRESRTDVSEARAEVFSSTGEVISEAWDVGFGNSHSRSASKGQVAELRDDQRDLRDDRNDLQTEKRDYSLTRAIAEELDQIQSRFDRHSATRADFERKNNLLGELLQMAEAEVVANSREIKEDRRERREDRRDR